MQFHLDGFQVGDPRIRPADPAAAARPAELPAGVDVLIVGSGPAGLVLAAQLAEFPGITTRIVERRLGPIQLGQADGIACRTVEMFEAFGFSEQLVAEAYWVNETVFWRPDDNDRSRIVRTGRVQDVEDGLSEFPHVIVNQARIHDYLLESMRRSPSRLEVDYGLEFAGLTVDESHDHPVAVRLRRTDASPAGEEVIVRARYVIGCDGARSAVRESIGRELHGDPANHAWGVMDILAITDFPDIRIKAAIQSGNRGNIVLIPREGGYLVRLYVDLGEVDPADRAAMRAMSSDEVVAIARRVLHPYTLEVKEIAWFSIYEVGQRLADKFDDVPPELVGSRTPRVFIAGDACHTHSAKAGQGMNVSMQDAFNLAWKLAAVLGGRCPESLLHTYSDERQAIAKVLIDFDKEWSAIMSSPPKDPASPDAGGVDPAELQEYYVQSLRYTAGVATVYTPSTLTGEATHQHLAKGFRIGMRFHSATGHSPRRRQAGASRSLPPRRRAVAAVRVRRRRRPGRSGVTAEGAVRAHRAVARAALHADRRRPRRRVRRARRIPAVPPRPPAGGPTVAAAAAEGPLRPDRLREGVRARLDNRRRRHLRPARHRPRTGCARRGAPRPVRRPRPPTRRLHRTGLLFRPAPSDGLGPASRANG